MIPVLPRTKQRTLELRSQYKPRPFPSHIPGNPISFSYREEFPGFFDKTSQVKGFGELIYEIQEPEISKSVSLFLPIMGGWNWTLTTDTLDDLECHHVGLHVLCTSKFPGVKKLILNGNRPHSVKERIGETASPEDMKNYLRIKKSDFPYPGSLVDWALW